VRLKLLVLEKGRCCVFARDDGMQKGEGKSKLGYEQVQSVVEAGLIK
jgi:hypothetical protein